MNIYLDIDGVLLSNSKQTAAFANEFIQLILKRWPDTTYWLTTHRWRGQNTVPEVLGTLLKPRTAKQLSLIKPAIWKDAKTEGINFKQPFLWFDDDLVPEEKKILEHYGALECLRRIDLKKDPYQLLDEIEYLRSLA